MIFLVDIDGTLADNNHREGFIQGDQKDWDAFYRPDLIMKDKPIVQAQFALPKLFNHSDDLFFHTGRPERTREVTAVWLKQHFKVEFQLSNRTGVIGVRTAIRLVMRQDGDHRPAKTYKEELPKQLKEFLPMEDIVFIDDDLRNAELYAKYGLFLRAPDCWGVIS